MSPWSYIAASLMHRWRINLSVAAGVAVATAVITGALIVGDSMRGSLRDLAIERLGRVDLALLADHPFRSALADELLSIDAIARNYSSATPLLLTQGAATARSGEVQRRAANLTVAGVPTDFWSLARRQDAAGGPDLAGNRAALTRNVAAELGVDAGDYLVLRIPLRGSVPADSSLGEKQDTVATRRLEVAAVLDPTAAMSQFSLIPNQTDPRNLFLSAATLQRMLDLTEQANAVVFAAATDVEVGPTALESVRANLHPPLVDFGLQVEELPPQGAARKRLQISSDRPVLNRHVVETVQGLYGPENVQSVVTYLANTIASGEKKIPYSTVSGVASSTELGPLLDEDGRPIQLQEDEVALNDWAATDLGVEVGDDVLLTYYEPETTHGALREATPLRLTLRYVAPLTDANGELTLANDERFAPELPGVTDQQSISDWDLPFELVETIRRVDEDYWDDYRTTPKAFLSPTVAERLWRTRWGSASVLRIPEAAAGSAERVAARLQEALQPAQLGMQLNPVRQQALAAASGTTPFDGLFLGFSFFLAASAVMLVTLLFRLGMEQRGAEAGLLLATGVPSPRIRRLFMIEAAIVAVLGASVGAILGVEYARVMVYGLNNWWVAATSAPFIELHASSRSLLVGWGVGVAAALASLAWTLRQLTRLPVKQLLSGDYQPSAAAAKARARSTRWIPATCLLGAAALAAIAWGWEGEAQAGAFFGGGALALIGLLALARMKIGEPDSSPPQSYSLVGLATRNARRNPSRTILALALAATASFLIVALSAFRLSPTDKGVGRFDVVATSDLPLLFDLNTPGGRSELGFDEAGEQQLAATVVVSFRMQEGEDASCLNLYQTTQPTILGAPSELAEQSDFAWASVDAPLLAATTDANAATLPTSPWQLLDADLGVDGEGRPVTPMILDRSTAFYSLKLYRLGDRLTVRDEQGNAATLQLVGLLANSVLQGTAIVGEPHFERLFPNTPGRRFFMIRDDANSSNTSQLAADLESRLEDFGFDAVDSRQRLAEFLAVQNTYLSTFQSLGGLGMLLGVVGLAVVQLRSVLERRRELALLRAAGFRKQRLVQLVCMENLVILLGGLAMGSAAALAAVLPHAAAQGASTPWATLAALLAVVALVGAFAGWIAVRGALAAPLIPALRGD